MNLKELIAEWNWDFDPSDQKSLEFAINEIAGYLVEQDAAYIVDILIHTISEMIVSDLESRAE